MPFDWASAPIFIGMPVFRGTDFLNETFQSILAQTFNDFKVLISVDGRDESSAELCSRYTVDPRFRLVVQPAQLGWAANLNWLMEQCDAPYFCYWQQDDICATSYLEALYSHAERDSQAGCVYADVQWFGSRFDRDALPTITGDPLQRVLLQIEAGHFGPFRGLVRADILVSAGPVRLTPYDSRLEDLVWVARLARYTELHRTSATLYFKRAHTQNAHSTNRRLTPEYRRAVWIEYGLGLLEVALPLVAGSANARLLNTILERLLVHRSSRWFFYDAAHYGSSEVIAFAADFRNAAEERFGPERWKGMKHLPDPHAILELMEAAPVHGLPDDDGMLRRLALAAPRSELMLAQLEAGGVIEESFASGAIGTALLAAGWSAPEAWGVWSDGSQAQLNLPVPCDGLNYRIELHGHAYVDADDNDARRIEARAGDATPARWSLTAAAPNFVGVWNVAVDPGSAHPVIHFSFPNALSPGDRHPGGDPRCLALALRKILIERQAPE